jgi:hypothetical protein
VPYNIGSRGMVRNARGSAPRRISTRKLTKQLRVRDWPSLPRCLRVEPVHSCPIINAMQVVILIRRARRSRRLAMCCRTSPFTTSSLAGVQLRPPTEVKKTRKYLRGEIAVFTQVMQRSCSALYVDELFFDFDPKHSFATIL